MIAKVAALCLLVVGATAQYQVPLANSVWDRTFTYVPDCLFNATRCPRELLHRLSCFTLHRYLDGTLDWAKNPAWTCNGKIQSPIAIDTSKVSTPPASVVPDLEKAFIAALPRGLLGTVSNLTLSNKSTLWGRGCTVRGVSAFFTFTSHPHRWWLHLWLWQLERPQPHPHA